MDRTIAQTGRLEKRKNKNSYLNAVRVRKHSKRKQTGRFFALALGESFHRPQEVDFRRTRVESMVVIQPHVRVCIPLVQNVTRAACNGGTAIPPLRSVSDPHFFPCGFTVYAHHLVACGLRGPPPHFTRCRA